MKKLGIFVKRPDAGRVKTRLGEAIGFENAAALYGAFVEDLVLRFSEFGDERILCYAPPDAAAFFAERTGDEYQLWEQPAGDLGVRLRAFFERHIRQADDRVVVIGSDSPTLPGEYVEQAFDMLKDVRCVLGPATDGGYYLLGMRGDVLPLFDRIPWSGPDVLDATVCALQSANEELGLLPIWYDVDTVADLRMLRGHVRALRHTQSPLNLDAVAEILESLRDDVL